MYSTNMYRWDSSALSTELLQTIYKTNLLLSIETDKKLLVLNRLPDQQSKIADLNKLKTLYNSVASKAKRELFNRRESPESPESSESPTFMLEI